MKWLMLVLMCLVLLSGCVEQKDNGERVANDGAVTGSDEKVIVTISSPRPGEVIKGDKDVSFEASARGGKEPYTYAWSSNRNSALSKKSSFHQDPSKLGKGQHTIVVSATDANGRSGSGSVRVYVA